MKKTKTPKKFEWTVSSYRDVDLDLLELQLYSLYKQRNINFDENLFKEDLKNSDGYLGTRTSKAVDLAIKSFCIAFKKVLRNHGIEIKKFHKNTVEDYSEYKLDVANSIIAETKGGFKRGFSDSNRSVGSRLTHIGAAPLSFFSLVRKDAHITYGAATNHMLKNLILWEKNIIEHAIEQLKTEKILKELFG